MKKEGWGRIINYSGANARNAGNLGGGGGLITTRMTEPLAKRSTRQLASVGIDQDLIDAHPRCQSMQQAACPASFQHQATESPMARIPLVTRAAVPQKEQPAYNAFSTDRGIEPNIGPYSIIAHMPETAQRLEALRTYVRKEASLSQTLQELVMLTVARETNGAFVWYAHAAAAQQAGVRVDIVDNIREEQALTGLALEEQTAMNFTRELLHNHKVGKVTFDDVTAKFGRRGTMTLTSLIACYAVLAYNTKTYELEAPPHATEPALPA
jgi:4-carboxymuconolactone decarboxylase